MKKKKRSSNGPNVSNAPDASLTPQDIQIIYKVARRVASKYVFGYHSYEDIVQEAVLIALKGIHRYNRDFPLENFLYVHLKNRLFTYRRDNYERLYRNTSTNVWESKEADASKKNLMSPLPLDNISDENEKSMQIPDTISEDLECRELQERIDRCLPVSYRKDYIKFKSNYKLPKQRLDRLFAKIQEILKYDEDDDEDDTI